MFLCLQWVFIQSLVQGPCGFSELVFPLAVTCGAVHHRSQVMAPEWVLFAYEGCELKLKAQKKLVSGLFRWDCFVTNTAPEVRNELSCSWNRRVLSTNMWLKIHIYSWYMSAWCYGDSTGLSPFCSSYQLVYMIFWMPRDASIVL